MQRFMTKLVSGVAISGLSASIALASIHTIKLTLHCPNIANKGHESVTNYGTYLAGTGLEKINGDRATEPLFEGPIVPGANIPVDLVASGYHNNGVRYNPTIGTTTCYYKSSMDFDPFSISYLMINGIGGYTDSSGSEEIHIRFPLGLK